MMAQTEGQVLECDLLVLGAGMAGLSAAGLAAEHGARVVVLEKAAEIGGSAALSGGILWTATSPARMQLYAGGSPELGETVLRNYERGLAWLRRREIAIAPAVPVLHGRGYAIDIVEHLRGCARLVEQHEGHVVRATRVERLLFDSRGAVGGARVAEGENAIEVRAQATILATGGYQNSAELRARHIHAHARDQLLLRTNPSSCGDGLQLGVSAGAGIAMHPGFYGHLVSESPEWGKPGLFTLLTQYHSDRSLLINEQGSRFCDESLGDHCNTYEVLAQSHARAILFWDTTVHRDFATSAIVKGTEVIDKMQVALERGGQGIVAASMEEASRFATAQGFDGERLRETVREYNRRCREGWETLRPGRTENFGALEASPFYALVVRPAITHTHGGLRVDAAARVLRGDGTPVPGLLAAGADAGNVYGSGYAGGLAMAMGFGIEAARSAGFADLR